MYVYIYIYMYTHISTPIINIHVVVVATVTSFRKRGEGWWMSVALRHIRLISTSGRQYLSNATSTIRPRVFLFGVTCLMRLIKFAT